MPESGEIDVAHVARLARLNLTEDETTLFQEQLRRVLDTPRNCASPTPARWKRQRMPRPFSMSCARMSRGPGSRQRMH